jgi:hypothetical protein
MPLRGISITPLLEATAETQVDLVNFSGGQFLARKVALVTIKPNLTEPLERDRSNWTGSKRSIPFG